MSHPNASSFSRRKFAALALAAAPALAQEAAPSTNNIPQNTSNAPAHRPDPTPPGEFTGPIEFTKSAFPLKAEPFPLTDVRLLGGRFQSARDANLAYMKRLPVDRLVYNFRINAGLPSSAQPFGGWEKPDCELRGHFTGHYLSACALMYASTGDAEIKARGNAIVSELAECQKKLNQGGYLSAFPIEFFDRLNARQKVWAPFYTIHKIMAGMFDMSQHCDNRASARSAARHGRLGG